MLMPSTNLPPPCTASTSSCTTTEPTQQTEPTRLETASPPELPRPESAPPVVGSAPPQENTPSLAVPTAAGGKKRRRVVASSPDPVDESILDNLSRISNVLQQPASRDVSDNVGQMVACQHRTLRPDQQQVFLAGIHRAYMEALQTEFTSPSQQFYQL